jgi:hypothetical protein
MNLGQGLKCPDLRAVLNIVKDERRKLILADKCLRGKYDSR